MYKSCHLEFELFYSLYVRVWPSLGPPGHRGPGLGASCSRATQTVQCDALYSLQFFMTKEKEVFIFCFD